MGEMVVNGGGGNKKKKKRVLQVKKCSISSQSAMTKKKKKNLPIWVVNPPIAITSENLSIFRQIFQTFFKV